MKNFPDIGLQIPQICLPKPGTDLTRWSVIACDQFTSQPDYWDKVESMVGDVPSTLRLTLPEIYLEGSDISNRIVGVQSSMRRYLDEGIVQPTDGMILSSGRWVEKPEKDWSLRSTLSVMTIAKAPPA